MEAAKQLFHAFTPPPAGRRDTPGGGCVYLFSWKASFNSGGGHFPGCHHPEPLARPFDQRGGETRGHGSQPSCKSHWSRSVNVSDVQTGVRQSVPGNAAARIGGLEKAVWVYLTRDVHSSVTGNEELAESAGSQISIPAPAR